MSRGESATRPRRQLRWLLGALPVAMLVLACAVPAFAEVTGAADNLRTGWYPDEPSLTPSLLSGSGFKQVFKASLEGQIYAQPLIADGTLLVVTEDDRAYGLDPVTGAVRWKKQLGEPYKSEEIGCTDLEPYVGITGTPVIDTETNVAYFVSNSYISKGNTASAWYMNAIELASGNEVANFPVKIEGEAQNLPPGVKFESTQELQRPALLMMNGVIYAGFGSHCDHEPYEGWVVGVSTSGQVTTKWATSGHGGSIWQAGGGLISDGPGQILFSTGNDNFEAGVFDPPEGSGLQEPPPEGKLGESVVRVEVQPGGTLKTKDYFSPFNNKELDEGDVDLGSSAPVALPSQYFGTPSVPELLVQEGKQGIVYLLNRRELGGRGKEADHVVQELGPSGGVWGAAAVWPGEGGYVYIPAVNNGDGFFRFYKYKVNGAGNPELKLVSTANETLGFGSGSPIVTSAGTTSGTAAVWITRCPEPADLGQGCKNAELVAYSPVPGKGEEVVPLWKAPIATAAKFTRPYPNAGHVYVGNNEGALFGFSGPELKPSAESLALGSTPVGGQLTGEVTFTNTGTPLTVSAVHTPATPFEATGLPPVGAKIQPGETVKVHVAFKSPTSGVFNGSLGLTTEAGETNIAVSASAITEPSPEPNPTPSGSPATTAGGTTVPFAPVSLSTFPNPLATLSHLKLHARLSTHGHHRRDGLVTYTLSAAASVQIAIYRRVVSHRCPNHARACARYVPTHTRLNVSGHIAANTLLLSLARLTAGRYRLSATPLSSTGGRGVTQYAYFAL
jgi:PQQ-like domain